MEMGKITAGIAALLLIATCAKPKLNGIADGVIVTMNDVSSSMSKSINGGFTEEEMLSCEQKTITLEALTLPTHAVVNIHIRPNFFSLYTEEHSFSDFDEPTWYEIDLIKNTFTYYTRSWRGKWNEGSPIEILYTEQESKKNLDLINPFQVARRRLGVRLGLAPNLLGGVNSAILLSDTEAEGVLCAGALNARYELLLRRAYRFK